MENQNQPQENNPIHWIPWKEICGPPKGWHTIAIWGMGHRPISPLITKGDLERAASDIQFACDVKNLKLPALMRQRVCYGVIQVHVDGTGLVTHRQVVTFKKPFIREDFPESNQMTENDWAEFATKYAEAYKIKS